MNPREQGFLLLTSQLGDPARKPLTPSQLRTLASRVRTMLPPQEDREMEEKDLLAMGYGTADAQRILALFAQQETLRRYLRQGQQQDCYPITRVSRHYPPLLRQQLGEESPGCLWAKGDPAILNTPAISLVGSRELDAPNRQFAEEAGRQAALQGFTLISGNARGADRVAQESCLAHGGKVICVVADALESYLPRQNVLYLSEDSFDLAFTVQRALSRNRVIHSLGQKTLVAQSHLFHGGTWDGTEKNLSKLWSPVFCYADGSEATAELARMGATLITEAALCDLAALASDTVSFFD